MCYLIALIRLPLLALRALTVAWGCLIEVHSVKSVTLRPSAGHGEVLMGGAARNGDIGPARSAYVATIEFMTPGPV